MSIVRAFFNFIFTALQWNRISKDPSVNSVVVESLNGNTVYAVTATRRLGLMGFGLYLSSPVVILETHSEAKSVRRIMADYMRYSSVVITGSSASIMKRVGGIGVMDFGNAVTVKEHMTQQSTVAVRKAISELSNPQSVFLLWLEGQIEKGNINNIDGYYFNNADPRAHLEGITELDKFLPAYYNSYRLATRTFNLPNFDTIDIFARELQFRVTAAAMGLIKYSKPDDMFPRVNAMLKANTDVPELEVVNLEPTSSHIRELSRRVG